MKIAKKRRVQFLLISCSIFLMCIIALAAIYHKYSPTFISGNYSISPNSPVSFELPLRHIKQNSSVVLNFSLLFESRRPSIFQIDTESCLESLSINGKEFTEIDFPSCPANNSLTLNLSNYLKSGVNVFQGHLKNYQGSARFDMTVSSRDLGVIILSVFFYSLVLLQSLLCFRILFNNSHPILNWIYAGGIIVRILYVLATPTGLREHDYFGHLEYIRYIAKGLSIPASNNCVLCYHPPLYYYLSGLWYKLMSGSVLSELMLWKEIQLGSFVFSVLTLGVGLWTGTLLFRPAIQKVQLYIYAMLLSFFPGLVLLSSRINNDSLVIFFSFLLFGVLVKCWKSSSYLVTLTLPLIMGLGLLTKKNILILFPAVFFVIVFNKKIGWINKIVTCLVTFLILLFVSNFLIPKTHKDLALEFQKPKYDWLKVENTFSNILTFNPLQVLKYVYNEPNLVTKRRDYFLEYAYKSAFFGEFDFGRNVLLLSRVLLTLGLMLGMLAIVGFAREVMTQKYLHSLPTLITFLSATSALLYLRLKTSLACSQDFRYIPIVVLPLIYYIAKSIQTKSIWLNTIAINLCLFFTFSSIIFFILIHFS